MIKRFSITGEDIINGLPSVSDKCPIALCIKRTMPEIQEVDVDVQVVQLKIAGKGINVNTSDECDWFISDFDDGEAVSPFEFELDIPLETSNVN